MAIKRTGPGTPAPAIKPSATGALSDAGQAKGADGQGFVERVGAPARAERSGDPVRAGVAQVAEAIKRGELETGEAVDAVIERIVQASGGAAGTAAKVREAQTALGDDPAFVLQVTRLLHEEGVAL